MRLTEPHRPSLPPVAWFAVCVWIGCVWGERVCTAAGSLLPIAGICTTFVALTLVVRSRRRTLATLLCCGLVAGATVSGTRWHALEHQRDLARDAGARGWMGVVEADPTIGAFGPTVRVQLVGGALAGARVRVAWPTDVDVPELGRSVRFSAILKPPSGDESWSQRLGRSGICATGTAWAAEVGPWRSGLRGTLYAWRASALRGMHRVPGPGGDLLEGIVLGDRRRLLGTAAEQDFRILGLTHLVAVSGSHLALACAAVALLCRMLHVPRRAAVPATVFAGAAYAVVTGMPYSALRSLLMLVVAGCGSLIGRRGDGLAALAVGVIAVLVLEPWAVFDVGFQLSVLAVGGLLLFGALATSWMSAAAPAWSRLAAEPLALTVVAQITTVPVIASSFGMLSVLAPVANALVGALVSLALLLGLAGALGACCLPAVSTVLVQASAAVLGITAWVASRMAAVPGAAVAVAGSSWLSVLSLTLLALLWAQWPMPRTPRAARRLVATLVAVSVALSLGSAPVNPTTVTVLDVGQGDAILVQDSGRSMLVDAGPDEQRMREALARTGLRSVDVLVLTHAHADHTGGASALPGLVTLGWIGVPTLADSAEGERDFPLAEELGSHVVRQLKAGDEWRVGRSLVRVLWPPSEPATGLKTNDTSVVLMVTRGAFDAVLTGDAEEAAQEGLDRAGLLASVDVLKVPHHGSVNGLTAEALDVWSPRTALVSVGTGNDFGHPSEGTMRLLREQGVSVLRTDLCGDLVVQVSDHGYRVATRRTARHRGVSHIVRARMREERAGKELASAFPSFGQKGHRGRYHTRVPEAGLPHLRGGGVAARSRAPPTSRPCGRGGRSRLQLRSLRWRER